MVFPLMEQSCTAASPILINQLDGEQIYPELTLHPLCFSAIMSYINKAVRYNLRRLLQ